MVKTNITRDKIVETVSTLVIKAAKILPAGVVHALKKAKTEEESRTAKKVLEILIKNAELAEKNSLPICQDTGIDCVFVELGRELTLDFDLEEAIQEGIRQGTQKGFLRASVADPLKRKNTGDNTPGILHLNLVSGRQLVIKLLPKGCGSENMSALYMLPPSAGINGIIEKVLNRVFEAGANPCPPAIIGIGIGGTMEMAALLSKKALLRPIGEHSKRDDVRDLEEKILRKINNLGIGPLGLGGRTTALWVSIEVYPCHIASLPVAINYQCHAARCATATLVDSEMEVAF